MPDIDGRPTDEAGFAIERRRPGRRDVSPELIPLLRRPTGDGVLRADLTPGNLDDEPALPADRDALAPARGVAVSLLLSLPLWCVVGALGFALNR